MKGRRPCTARLLDSRRCPGENLAVRRRPPPHSARFSSRWASNSPGTKSAIDTPGMLHVPQFSRALARVATLTLVAAIALGGGPASAFAGMNCDDYESHALCQEHTARDHHCSKNGAVISCACHGSEQPANSPSSRATDVAAGGVLHPSHPSATPAGLPLGLSRPDYPLARGRYFVPLPILHASLLI